MPFLPLAGFFLVLQFIGCYGGSGGGRRRRGSRSGRSGRSGDRGGKLDIADTPLDVLSQPAARLAQVLDSGIGGKLDLAAATLGVRERDDGGLGLGSGRGSSPHPGRRRCLRSTVIRRGVRFRRGIGRGRGRRGSRGGSCTLLAGV